MMDKEDFIVLKNMTKPNLTTISLVVDRGIVEKVKEKYPKINMKKTIEKLLESIL
jgi:hypothetical protein